MRKRLFESVAILPTLIVLSALFLSLSPTTTNTIEKWEKRQHGSGFAGRIDEGNYEGECYLADDNLTEIISVSVVDVSEFNLFGTTRYTVTGSTRGYPGEINRLRDGDVKGIINLSYSGAFYIEENSETGAKNNAPVVVANDKTITIEADDKKITLFKEGTEAHKLWKATTAPPDNDGYLTNRIPVWSYNVLVISKYTPNYVCYKNKKADNAVMLESVYYRDDDSDGAGTGTVIYALNREYTKASFSIVSITERSNSKSKGYLLIEGDGHEIAKGVIGSKDEVVFEFDVTGVDELKLTFSEYLDGLSSTLCTCAIVDLYCE